MSANNLIRRLMTRGLRNQKTTPIRKSGETVGRSIERLEDRSVPATISTVATGLSGPFGIAYDSAGDIYFADSGHNEIKKIAAGTGTVTIVAGTGTAGYTGNNGLATSAELNYPNAIALDSAGNLYIDDTNNYVIRKVSASTGIITTIAGTGTEGSGGNATVPTSTSFGVSYGVAVDSSGNIFISDSIYNCVWEVKASNDLFYQYAGVVTTTGSFSGDSGAATSAHLNYPAGMSVDTAGDLFIDDSANNRIREVNASTGIISTVAGNGTAGYTGDNGPATSADLSNETQDVAVDSSGNLYIADSGNNVIREVTASTGKISTIAGNGTAGYTGDMGPATSAELNFPGGVAVDSSGDIAIDDSSNNVIRKVAAASPTITATPTSLGLGTTPFGTASAPQTYTVSGTNLTANITITPPIGVELSTNGTSYNSSLTLTESGGTVASTTIYARISASASAGSISSNITNVSGTASQNVSVTGAVAPVGSASPMSQTVVNNANTTTITFSSNVTGASTTYTWTNSNTSIGLGASGSGPTISSFVATNSGSSPVTATITVTPTSNGVTGATFTSTITVNPTPPIIYNDSLNTGALSITQAATGNDALTFAESGGNYILTDTGGLQFGTPTGSGAGSITLSNGNATLTVPASAVTSITITLGTGTNSFTFTGTGGATAAPITLSTGSTAADTISITGAVSDSGALSLTSGGTITESGSGATTDSGGTVTTSSVGGTTLGGANAITTFNATNSTSGSVSLTNTGTLSVSGLTDSAGGTDTITNTGNVSFPNALTLGSGLTVSDGSGNTTFSSTVNGGKALTLTTTGATNFSGALGGTTPLASVSVSGGTTTLNGQAATTSGAQSYSNLIITTGPGTLTTTNSNITIGGTTALAYNLAVSDGTGSTTFTGAVNSQSSPGQGTLSVTSSGTTTFSAGVGTTNAVTSLSITTGALTAGAITTTSGLTVNDSGAGSVTGAITGSGATLTKQGAGTLTLTGTNTYTGTTTISTGTLQIGSGGAAGSLGTGTVTDSASLVFDLSSSSTVSNLISGTGTLSQSGTGTLTLGNSSNTYSGSTTITSGTLAISADTDLGTAPASFTAAQLTISGGAVLQTIGSVTLATNRGVTVGAGGGTFTLGGTFNYAGRFTGSGNTLTTGGSDFILTNSTGTASNVNYIVSANRLFFSSTNALGTGSVQVNSGAILDNNFGSTATTVTNAITLLSGAGLSSRIAATYSGVTLPTTGSVIFNNDDQATSTIGISASDALTGTLTVQVGGNNSTVGTTTLSGNISGSGDGLTKTQVGTLILSGTNSFSGATSDSAGTLLVNGSDANSAITVSSGAVLGGTGTTGAVTVNSGGKVDPATTSTTGTLSTAALTLSSGSTYQAEVNTGGSDQIAASGTITLTGSTLSVSGTIGSSAGQVIQLITNNSGSPIVGMFSNYAQGATVTINGTNFVISYTGGVGGDNVTLTQPGTWNLPVPTSPSGVNIILQEDPTGTQLQEIIAGSVVNQEPLTAITSVTVTDSTAVSNTVTINYAGGVGGNGFYNLPVTYNGNNTSAEALTVEGGSFNTITDNYTPPVSGGHTGNLVFDKTGTGTNTDLVSYTGLAPVNTVGSTAANFIINLPVGGTSAQLTDQGSGTLQIANTSGVAFETTQFSAPTNLLTINRGSSTDTVSVSALTSTPYTAGLTIGSLAAPLGTVTLGGAFALSTGTAALTVYAGAINITTGTDSATSGITLDATTGAITESGTGALGTSPPGALSTTSTTGTTLSGAGTNAVSVWNATNSTSGNISLTNTAGTLTITGISNTGTGAITVNNTGTVSLTTGNVSTGSGNINLTASGSLSETSPAIINTTGTLSTNTTTGTTLTDTNTVGTFNATNTTSGNISFTNSGALTVTGISNTGTGTITVSNTGSVSLTTGNVSTGSGAINLTASGSLSETSPAIISTTGTLTTSSGTGTTLTDTNTVSTFNATNTASGNVSFTNSGTLTVTKISNVGTGTITVTDTGSVSLTTSNVSTGSGAINLTATGGTLSETSPAIISTTGTLTTSSGTGTTLTDTNTVGTFNATNTTSGNISFTNSGALAVSGISETGGGSVTVNNTGSITISGNVSATAGGAVNLTSSGAISESGTAFINTTGTLTTSSASGTTLNNANTVGTFNATNTTSGNISLINTASPLTITGITESGGGSVTVTNTGSVTISGNISAASGGAVNLTSSGAISESGTAFINTTGTLTTSSATGTTLNNANTVGTFNATNTTSGNISLINTASPLTVTGISESGGGSVTVNNTGSVTISGNVSATAGGAVNLTSSGAISESGTAFINTTGTLTTSSATGTTLNNANTVGTFNATNSTSGNVQLTNTAAPLTITGITETGGGITVTNTGSIVTSTAAILDNTAGNAISLTATTGSMTLGAAVTGTTTDTISLTSTGSANTIAVNAAVTTGSGNISATSAGSISETGGKFGTTGLLTTNSGSGTTLGGANTVSSFNATNTTSGNISLTNTASPLTVTGISETGGTVSVTNAGSITLSGNVTDTTGGNVSLTATGAGAAISESGTAIVNTTGTLTTNSVGGTTLNNANTVGTFNATNTPGGNVSLVNTAAAFVISGISETGGTTTVTNTGSTTINGTGITSTGNITVSTTANLTVSSAVASTGGSTSLNFGSNNTGDTANINAAVTASTTATLTGGTGNDTINVTRMGATNLTVNGGGGSDGVNIYANTRASSGYPGSLGSGEVVLTGTSTYTATVNGIGSDTIDVNDQNQSATSPPPAPNGAPVTPLPAITTGSGVASVATNGVDVLNYIAATLPTLYLAETTGTNTYNIQFPNSVSGSKLPATVTIQTSTTTDTANLFGPSKPATFNVGFSTPGTTTEGSNAVTYPEGSSAYLQTLNVYGGDAAGTIGDTFKVFPDAHTAVNINAGLPTSGTGDTLILNAFGLTNPVIVPLYHNTALPNGEITSSNKAPVSWNSIETFPVPLGLGGTFDFQPNGSATQAGFYPVYSTDTPAMGQYSTADDGWLDSGAGSFDRSTLYNGALIPNSPQLATLLETGEWGNSSPTASGSSADGEFQISVAPNQPIQVTAYMGDTNQGRLDVNVWVGVPGNQYSTLLNPSSTTFTTASQNYQYVSYSGMFNPGASTLLEITFQTVVPGQFWTVSGLDVRPLGLIAPLTITRADSAAVTTPQLANGTTVDTYYGAGAAPGAEVTINPQYGTPYGTDADPSVAGFQVVASATGTFTFQILRPTGSGTSLISVEDVTGASATGQVGPTGTGGLAVSPNPYILPNPVYQFYALPTVRQIDFGPLGTPAASDTDQDVVSAAITTAGTGYAVGDLLTVQGGSFYTAAQLMVTSVGGTGNITGVSVLQGGDYLTTPTNPVSVTDTTTGSASGGTFTLTFGYLNYLLFANAAYTSTAANALGWIGTAPVPFDRGSSYNNLQRDGVYGTPSTPGLFELDMPAANTTYSITVILGDAVYQENGMSIEAINPTTMATTMIATGVSTAGGQSTSFTFPVTTDSMGRIQLEFAVAASQTNGFWTLQDVEVRPEVAMGTPPVGTQVSLTVNGTKYTGSSTGTGMAYSATSLTGTVPADGMTSTTYSITGANPNALLTITTSLGTLTTSDGGPTYTGIQVQASASGTASFTITSPLSTNATTATITVADVTGASLGVFTQNYSAYSPPVPPTSPPASIVERLDFTSGGSPAQAGFTSVPNTTVYSATTGYGWVTAVNGYDRGAGSVPAGYPQNLFRAGAWGQGSGTFEVTVPAGSTDDVRVYVGDPYNAWSGITVSADGGAAVAVDPVLDRFGYVTVYGVTDTHNTGLLSITISGPVWVVSGMDVATTSDLPTPATGLATAVTSKRLEFASTAIGGFTAVSNTTTYTPTTGYGWESSVGSFVRPASYFPTGSTLTATQMQFYGSGAWGQGSATFEFAVPLNSPSTTYSVRAYVSDPYDAWGGITLSGEGAATSPPVTASIGQSDASTTTITLTGLTDINGDGIITLTVTGQIWVLNGLEIVQGGMGNLPTQPQAVSVTGPAPGAAPVVPLTAAQLAPIAAAAVARWEEAGITPAQDALLKSVQYSIGNLSGQGALGLTGLGSTQVQIDATADGRGWFIDPTPNTDSEFTQVASTEEMALPSTAAAGHYDLLTVVEHELGHVLGLIDLSNSLAPTSLMATDLSPGVRRLPDAAAVSHPSGPVSHVVAGLVPVSVAVSEPVTIGSTSAGASTAPQQWLEMTPTALAQTVLPASPRTSLVLAAIPLDPPTRTSLTGSSGLMASNIPGWLPSSDEGTDGDAWLLSGVLVG